MQALIIAMKQQKPAKGLIPHSDQGSQFTLKELVRFCDENFIQQSMNRAGCPYDNAPMERYFNIFEFETEQTLDTAVAEFAYGWHKRIRTDPYNDGKTPAAARVAYYLCDDVTILLDQVSQSQCNHLQHH
jgi:transposase InsO family protein